MKENLQENFIIENLEKVNLWDNIPLKLEYITVYFSGILSEKNFSEESFQDFLRFFISKNNIQEKDINWTEFKDDQVYIYTDNWKKYNFNFKEYKNFLIKKDFKDIESQKLQMQVIHIAMESIFQDNTWIFDELDNDDIVNLKRVKKLLKRWKIKWIEWKTNQEVVELVSKYLWKNLIELKEEAKVIQDKFIQYYDIIWTSKKSQEILERQIDYYAWIWDAYEWWARVFWSKTNEIVSVVSSIVSHKTWKELIDYIRITNNKISNNTFYSDITKRQNLLVVETLVEKTFEKLKKENASERDFINFIRVITGRRLTNKNWEVKPREKVVMKNGREAFETIKENIVNVDNEFKQTDLANKALIYLMHNKKIVEKINKKKKINFDKDLFVEKEQVYEEYVGWYTKKEKLESVDTILDKSVKEFEKIWLKKEPLLKSMWLDGLEWKQTKDLSFEKLLALTAFYKIAKDVKENIYQLKWKSGIEIRSFFQERNNKALSDAFEELNDNFEDNFASNIFDWNWTQADDLWLEWELWEIFDLYWEINGRWAFEFSDDNYFAKNFLTMSTWVVLWVWVITAAIVLSPAVIAWWLTWLAIAWTEIWITTTIASQLTSKKWYDTIGEAAVWIWIQSTVDIVSSALFTMWSWWVIWKYWWKAFSKALQEEIKTWQLTSKTSEQLWKVLKEWEEQLLKNSKLTWRILDNTKREKYWRPVLQRTIDEMKKRTNIELSQTTIDYVSRYLVLNWTKWNLVDMWIWIWDWMFAWIVWQIIELWYINEHFLENHFNPDAWETYTNVYDLKESKQKELLEKQKLKLEQNIAWNQEMQEKYHELTKEEKEKLYFVLLLLRLDTIV